MQRRKPQHSADAPTIWTLLSARLLPIFLLLALGACCKRSGPPPGLPTPPMHPCLTEALLASRPRQPTVTGLSSHGLAMLDLLAHAVLVRDAYIDRLIVNCRSVKQ
jgi:hypothetical protein